MDKQEKFKAAIAATKAMGNDPHDDLLASCIAHITLKLSGALPTPIMREEFCETLNEIFAKNIPPCKAGAPVPFASFTLIIDGFCSGLARVIVGVSGIGPEGLQDTAGMNDEEVILLRRGLEDHLTEMVQKTLKCHVLDQHTNYNEEQEAFARGLR